MYLKYVENLIPLSKLIGLLFLFCLPLLSILFLKTKRKDLARPVMGTIFLVIKGLVITKIMKITNVLTLSSICKQNYCNFQSVVYPKVVLTVVFIPTAVYILTVVSSLFYYSPQHSLHSCLHVIFISAYPTVRVKFYAYEICLAEYDLIID